MAEGVEPRRRYESPRRQEQAAATRRAILEAARRLFERQGYAATSMAAIAAEAGVALKTVYLGFATKRGVLLALWHLLLRGDEEPVPVGERAWFREVLEEPDPERQLRLNARNSRVVRERAGALLRVLSGAASTDSELAALWERIQAEFHENQRTVVETLAARKALRADLDVERATDVLWALNHPSLYWLLVGDRGWTHDEYEQWLGDAFCRELLGRAAAEARGNDHHR
jgi:AcrR family transcriptional regulator